MILSLIPGSQSKGACDLSGQPQLIADLFHALNQPLTALQCSVELNLRQACSAEQYRDTLQGALQYAEQIARQVSGIRELLQADDPGDNLQVLSLGSFLRELVTDLEPVAELLGVWLSLHGASQCHVVLEPHRLQQALFHLVESALYSSAAGGAVKLQMSEAGKDAVIRLDTFSSVASVYDSATGRPPDKTREISQRLSLAIVSRVVEAAGGSLQIEHNQGRLHVELRLPLELTLP